MKTEMRVHIIEEPITQVAELARISIAFTVKSVLAASVQGNGLGGFLLSEREVDVPYVKDYDAFETEGPTTWARRFDVSRWAFFGAYREAERIGGVVVAFDTKGVTMLEGRRDLAVIWDIRVTPQMRSQGVGSALFRTAEQWARAKQCRHIKVETQNTNVAACRFYVRHGCELGALHRFAYPDLPGDIQLLWYKALH